MVTRGNIVIQECLHICVYICGICVFSLIVTKMRVPIRRNTGFNSDRRPFNGSIHRWNYPYSSCFGRRIGNRVYGMPFGNQQVQRREFKQTQRLTKASDHVSCRRKSSKTVEEIHDGTDYLLCSNMSKVSYISYPPLSSTEYGSRAESYLKVLGVTVSGSVVLKQTGMSEADGSHGIHGIFTTVVVRDRRPCQFSAVDPIIPFAELFWRRREGHAPRYVLEILIRIDLVLSTKRNML
uniref:BV1 protein n=1 Tax=Pepper yellow leaf curl Thailand virus TaxID=1774200 RepID=A0A5P9S3G2_9GEMI|nr:hypothetical protein [Pepper yellow leaf curl Thailand virus]